MVATSDISSGNYQSPYPTTTDLSATSTQSLGSGHDISLMTGQSIVMITLAHARHGAGSISLPTVTATVATSSLSLSSAGVVLASETATVNKLPLTLSSANTISTSAATDTSPRGVVQSFYNQTPEN